MRIVLAFITVALALAVVLAAPGGASDAHDEGPGDAKLAKQRELDRQTEEIVFGILFEDRSAAIGP